MLKVVIFDMDGVIVDSEPLHKIYRCKFAQNNNISQLDAESAIGKSKREFYNELIQKYNLKETADELTKKEFKTLIQMAKDQKIQPMDGLIELLSYIKENNLKIAIASSSDRNFVDEIIEMIGIKKYIDVAFTGSDVIKLKPFPDIYQKVLNYFDYQPEEALAIEDSTNGSKAALNAHIECVGYQAPIVVSVQNLNHCPYIVTHLSQIKNIIKNKLH